LAEHKGGGNITGTVKDKSGNPIIGAAVTIPNTARGTSTDIDGRYTIKATTTTSSSEVLSSVSTTSIVVRLLIWMSWDW